MLRHFFADLPYTARKFLFEFIDYDTRFRIRECSLRTRRLIDTLQTYFDKILIKTDPFIVKFWEISNGNRLLHFLNDYDEIEKWEKGEKTKNTVNEKAISNTIEKLGIIFSNGNVKTRRMLIRMSHKRPNNEKVVKEEIYLTECLMKMMLYSLERQILVADVRIEFQGNQDEVLCFLPYLKSRHLKRISLVSQTEILTYDKVTSLRQLKEAERVIFDKFPTAGMPLDSFWNIPRVRLISANLSACEINQLLEHYLQQGKFEWAEITGMHTDWLPDTFLSSENGNLKCTTFEGPLFGIKVYHYIKEGLHIWDKVTKT